MPPTQDPQTTYKPNLTCILLSARTRYIISIPNGGPCMHTLHTAQIHKLRGLSKVKLISLLIFLGCIGFHFVTIYKLIAIFCDVHCTYTHQYTLWHYVFWSFQAGGTKLERKLLKFEIGIIGRYQKVPKFDFQSLFSIFFKKKKKKIIEEY